MMTYCMRARWIVLTAFMVFLIGQPRFGIGQTSRRPAAPRSGGTPASAPKRQANGTNQASPRDDNQAAQRGEQADKVDPELLRVLQLWEDHTSHINSLEGQHHRFTYDMTFQVEKRAEGHFYYEAPDKGRIDLESSKVKEGEVNEKMIGSNGKPFRVEGAMPEMWISNGKEIIEVNQVDKTYTRIPLPETLRGKNIMDGPLPFLFGMPAESALKRFQLELLPSPGESQIMIKAKPRWPADAANYSVAFVILNEKTFLPFAVKLVHPGSNEETVYRFHNLDINKKPSFFAPVIGMKDPFDPPLKGYKEVQNQALNQQRAENNRNANIRPVNAEQDNSEPDRIQRGVVPNLRGMHFKKAEEALKTAGFKPKWIKGDPAEFKEQAYTAYAQSPKPGEKYEPGETVLVKLFDKFPEQGE